MSKMLPFLMLLGSLASPAMIAQRSRPQDVELQQAIRTETIDGDVAGAIRLYATLADKYARSAPDVASQALLRQAHLYQTLGDSRARATFERIVHEFPAQQKAVALASQALGTRRSLAQERVFAGSDTRTILSVSPDGRWMALAGPDGFSLRRIPGERDEASFLKSDIPVFSNDSRQLAFNRFDKREFQIARVDGTGARTVRVNAPDVRYYNPAAWSPDGQRILVEIVHQDFSKEIAWLSVKSGDLTVLANVGWRRGQSRPERLSLSPDGRSIVYSGLTVAPTAPLARDSEEADRSLFLISADGGAPKELVSGDVNVGPLWTPDGRHIVYVSNRGGTFGLWSLNMADAAQTRLLEMPATGRIVPIGITTTGTLFFGRDQDGNDLLTATLGADGRFSSPAPLTTGHAGGNFSPVWSPDGRFIAYKRRVPGPEIVYSLVVHTVADHTERVFDAHALAFGAPAWFSDNRRILVAEATAPGRQWLLDLASGSFTAYADTLSFGLPPMPLGFALSPDDRVMYALRPAPASSSTISRGAGATVVNQPTFILTAVDLGTGVQKAILRAEDRGTSRGAAISPNGAFMALAVNKPGVQDATLLRIDLTQGSITDLASPVDPRMLMWSADSRAIYVLRQQGSTSHLMRVPAAGGAPQDTGLVVPSGRQRGASLHDGTLVFNQESAVHEVWAIKGLYPR